MPIVGIVCMEDKTFQPFHACIHKHECFEARTCPALTFAIKLQRDNMKHRADAGISASTLINCPRANALLSLYDYYEPVEDGWVKSFGTIIHSMIESDPDEMPNTIRERRVKRSIVVDGEEVWITGKPDEVNVVHGVLLDYKTKEVLPSKADYGHEFQFNVYSWILRNGVFVDTGETCNVVVTRGGMHYITRKSKNPFKKIGYPVWPEEMIEAKITERLLPNIVFKHTGEIPACNPFKEFGGRWRCDCAKIEEQLEERGVERSHG